MQIWTAHHEAVRLVAMDAADAGPGAGRRHRARAVGGSGALHRGQRRVHADARDGAPADQRTAAACAWPRGGRRRPARLHGPFPVAAGTAPRRFLRQADGRRRLLPYGMAERGTRRLPGTGLGQPCAGRPALLQHRLPGLRQRPGSARLGAGSQRPAGGTRAVLPRRIRAGRPCRAVVSRALRAQRRATAATPHQGGLRHPSRAPCRRYRATGEDPSQR